nr:hypothetical protein [Thiocapsa sp. KS1]
MAIFAVATVLVSRSAHPDLEVDNTEDNESPLKNSDVATPEQKIQIMQTPDEPLSLQGINRETYNSPYGFKITYPSTWRAEEYPARPEEGVLSAWSVSPIAKTEFGASLNPLIVMVVYDVSADITEGVYTGTGTARTLSDPDDTQGQTTVELNGRRGIYATGFGGVSTYEFLESGRRYHILVNDTLLRKESFSEAELNWVLSTLYITPK